MTNRGSSKSRWVYIWTVMLKQVPFPPCGHDTPLFRFACRGKIVYLGSAASFDMKFLLADHLPCFALIIHYDQDTHIQTSREHLFYLSIRQPSAGELFRRKPWTCRVALDRSLMCFQLRKRSRWWLMSYLVKCHARINTRYSPWLSKV